MSIFFIIQLSKNSLKKTKLLNLLESMTHVAGLVRQAMKHELI